MTSPINSLRSVGTLSSKDDTDVRRQLRDVAGRVSAVAQRVLEEDEESVSSVSSTSSSDSDGNLPSGVPFTCVTQ